MILQLGLRHTAMNVVRNSVIVPCRRKNPVSNVSSLEENWAFLEPIYSITWRGSASNNARPAKSSYWKTCLKYLFKALPQ
jgi:hypothetical protein